MSKKHIFVVDGNSIAHAAHNGSVLTVGDMQVQAVFGFLRSMRALLNTSANSEVIVLWDGKAEFRKELYPAYKANRDTLDPKQEAHRIALRKQTPLIEKAMTYLGVRQARCPHLEADDLAGFLVPKLALSGRSVTMVSGDKDWIQAVTSDVVWFDPIRDRTCSEANFLEFTGYETPLAFVQGKALIGDSSDNISGVGGIGKVGAPIFLARWKNVYRFLQEVDDGNVPKLTKAECNLVSEDGRATFERNMNLMDWKRSPKPKKGEVVYSSIEANPQKFKHLCERLAFASIVRELDPFLKSFGIQE